MAPFSWLYFRNIKIVQPSKVQPRIRFCLRLAVQRQALLQTGQSMEKEDISRAVLHLLPQARAPDCEQRSRAELA